MSTENQLEATDAEISSRETEEIDINNLDLAEEALEIEEGGDAFATPAPPPDGVHLVKFRLAEDKPFVKVPIKKGPNRGSYFLDSNIVLTVIDPDGPLDGKVIFDSANCLVRAESGQCRVSGILEVFGEDVSGKTSDVELMRKLNEIAQTEPEIKVKGQWQGYSKEQKKVVKYGMKSFPEILDSDDQGTGVFSHVFDDPNTGEEISARFRVRRYISVGGSD